jgi:hypothetical protein
MFSARRIVLARTANCGYNSLCSVDWGIVLVQALVLTTGTSAASASSAVELPLFSIVTVDKQEERIEHS